MVSHHALNSLLKASDIQSGQYLEERLVAAMPVGEFCHVISRQHVCCTIGNPRLLGLYQKMLQKTTVCMEIGSFVLPFWTAKTTLIIALK